MKYNENTIATVGDRLKTLRKKRGYSAESLAEIMGCSEKTIRNRESGQIAPLEELLKYCDVLDCDMGYLLGQYEEKDSDTLFIASKTGLSEEAIEHLIDNVGYDDIVTEIDEPWFSLNSFLNYFIPRSTNITMNIRRIISDDIFVSGLSSNDSLKFLYTLYLRTKLYPDLDLCQHKNEELFYKALKYILHENDGFADSETVWGSLPAYGKTSRQYISGVVEKVLSKDYDDSGIQVKTWALYHTIYPVIDRTVNEHKMQQFIISDTFMDIVKKYVKKEVKEKAK